MAEKKQCKLGGCLILQNQSMYPNKCIFRSFDASLYLPAVSARFAFDSIARERPLAVSLQAATGLKVDAGCRFAAEIE